MHVLQNSQSLLAEPRQPIYCSEGTFSCLDGEKCVPGESICGGGTAHCVDQSDQDPMWCSESSCAYKIM